MELTHDFDPDEMHYSLRPVISIDELQRCIEIDTGHKFEKDFRELLFSDCYMNDVYCSYYFADDVGSWVCESRAKELRLVNKFLQENFGPEYDSILVDVSW